MVTTGVFVIRTRDAELEISPSLSPRSIREVCAVYKAMLFRLEKTAMSDGYEVVTESLVADYSAPRFNLAHVTA